MSNTDGQHRPSTIGPQHNSGQRQVPKDPRSSGHDLGRSIVPPSRRDGDIDTTSGAAGDDDCP